MNIILDGKSSVSPSLVVDSELGSLSKISWICSPMCSAPPGELPSVKLVDILQGEAEEEFLALTHISSGTEMSGSCLRPQPETDLKSCVCLQGFCSSPLGHQAMWLRAEDPPASAQRVPVVVS